MGAVVQKYTAALFDLDGVVYLGPQAVDGAAEGIDALRAAGTHVGFVTNNAARGPRAVVDHLSQLGIHAEAADVVTSAQAVAQMMAKELPRGSRVLVLGTDALAAEIEAVGLVPEDDAVDQPVAVVQGYHPELSWSRVEQACHAIFAGAQWYASNTDSTRPTDKGLVPGAGAQQAIITTTTGAVPKVAGKPSPPLMHATMDRLGTTNCIFVGDRIDTDIMGAAAVGMDSLFVFTGAHGVADLVAADESGRPTHIGWDLRALLEPARMVECDADGAACRGQRVSVREGKAYVTSSPTTRSEQLDALWAVLQLVWARGIATDPELLSVLDQLH